MTLARRSSPTYDHGTGEIRKPLPREVEDGYEVFEPTPDGIVRWVRSTRPTPDPADVAAYVEGERAAGRLSDRDVREVHRRLRELAGR